MAGAVLTGCESDTLHEAPETVTATETVTVDGPTETVEVTVDQPTKTVVVPVEPESAPEPTQPEPVKTTQPSDEEIADLALEITWSSLTAEDQESLCLGMALDPNLMIDAFLEGAGDGFASRSQVEKFFDGKCR